MAGKLKHRHQSSIPPSGADVSSTEWNDSLVASEGSDGQVMTRDSGQTDGWKWTTPSSFTPDADALNIAKGSAAGSYNLSSLGTYDYLFTNSSVNLPRQIAAGSLHQKPIGGWLALGFDWVDVGGATVFTQAITPSITTSAADDCHASAASGATGGQGLFTTAGTTYGFRLHVPAFNQGRTLVVYTEHFSCQITCSVNLHGRTITQSSLATTNGTSGGGASEIWTITYSAGFAGWLNATFLLSTVLGVNQSPNVKFGFAYIT